MMAFGMLLALPLMLLAILVLVSAPFGLVVWLARATARVASPMIPAQAASAVESVCPNCHNRVGVNWRSCAYCGEKLA